MKNKIIFIVLGIVIFILLFISLYFINSKTICKRTIDMDTYIVESKYTIKYFGSLKRIDTYESNDKKIIDIIEDNYKNNNKKREDNKLSIIYKVDKEYDYYKRIKLLKNNGYICK